MNLALPLPPVKNIIEGHLNQTLGVYMAIVMSMILGVAGWTAAQFVAVRDSVEVIQSTVPVKLDALSERLNTLDQRLTHEDDRIYDLERGQAGLPPLEHHP